MSQPTSTNDDFKIDDNLDTANSQQSTERPFPKNMPPIPTDEIPPLPVDVVVDKVVVEEVIVETRVDEVIVTDPESEQPEPKTAEPQSEESSSANETMEEDMMNERLDRIEEAIVALSEKFEQRVCNDERRDTLFNKMYDELAAYKNDIYAKLLKPMVLATVTMLDDVNRMIDRDIAGRESAEIDVERLVRFVKGLPGDLEEILLTNGVEIYSDTDSETFNPRTQRALKQIATDDPAKDKQIAARIRNGYRWNGVQLRPEMVHIYKYQQN